MGKFTVEGLNTQAKNKFGDMEIELADGTEVVLQSVLRLPKDVRKKVLDYINLEGNVVNALIEKDEDADQYDAIKALLRDVAMSVEDFDKLAEEVGDNPGTWVIILDEYLEVAVGGKASTSTD